MLNVTTLKPGDMVKSVGCLDRAMVNPGTLGVVFEIRNGMRLVRWFTGHKCVIYSGDVEPGDPRR